jgi:hypothetical protein
MNSVVDVTSQAAGSSSNKVVYGQTLSYDATDGAKTPENYAVLPYADPTYNKKLVKVLSSTVPGFANLSGTISQPEINANANKSTGSGGLSKGAIIGIAVGGGVLLLVALGCCAYALGNRDRRGSTYMDTDDNDNNRMPSQFQMSHGGDDDIISTMDDPTVAKIGSSMDQSAIGGYGDQRCVDNCSLSVLRELTSDVLLCGEICRMNCCTNSSHAHILFQITVSQR